MLGFTAAVTVAVAVALTPADRFDAAVTPAGFWPGGGSAWSGTTSYYGFGREVPYGFGFGAEAYGPRLGVYGPDGRRYDYAGPPSPSPLRGVDQTRRPPVYGQAGVGVGGGRLFRRR